MYSQRDIVLVQFPFTDLSGSKLRPALVISCREVNALRDLICIQVTSKIFDDGLFIPIQDNQLTTALKLKSGIRLHKIFTVSEGIVLRKISSFTSTAFENIMNEFSLRVLKNDL